MLTTRFVTGAPNWLDLGTTDIDGAAAFYRGLFGWELRSAGSDSGGYGFFQLDGRTVAGGMQTPPEQGPPSWSVYFRSPDADATAEAAQRAGGAVLMAPDDVMDKGRLAFLRDSTGGVFGLWQPKRTRGVEVVGDPGSLCWIELYTLDVPAAAAFYHSILGLETSSMPFPGGVYTCVNPADGGEETVFGGIVPLADDPVERGAGAYWLPYFEVTDTDAVVARAEELGGTVRMPATTMEGVGRMAKLADPYGARFAVIRSEASPE
ncbi:VOC family protein [Streptomyces fructofermentans]|uniref:Hydroxylase n=1 Tax=Streptomyces fructofermentans TaxID=152141 RepID=A0A918K3L7_9ACTN|nr:VOC family protein [Streptomyces fructofermentans]GGX44227.1 hydroxylase [Streptomyces fructofermentans]